MPDPTTTNLVLAVPVRGSDVGTWDTPVNGDMAILDACAGNVTTKSLSNANVTLSTTESQVAILRFSGVLTGNVIITLGAIIKSWICENNTTGAFTITVKGSPGTGNVVGLPPGSSQVYWDGVNVSFINLERVGAYWDYAGATVPAWVTACTVPPFLLCDGSVYNSTTYPLLFAILGTTTLPDARGRTRFALNGGQGRLTTAGGIDGDTRFAGGGTGAGLTVAQANLPNVNFNGTAAVTINNILIKYSTGLFAAGVNSAVTGINVGLANTGNTGTVQSDSGACVAASGGSGTALASVSPGYVGGIVLLRAA